MQTNKHHETRKLRPKEITEAALKLFSENGYAQTKIDDVAREAGVSKGLVYLYFKTKEELFKEVVMGISLPKIEELSEMANQDSESATLILRNSLCDILKEIPKTEFVSVIQLLVAEGNKQTDLLNHHWASAVSPALEAIRKVIKLGVKQGEFRADSNLQSAHLILAPIILSMIWKILFDGGSLNSDRLIEEQINLLIEHLSVK